MISSFRQTAKILKQEQSNKIENRRGISLVNIAQTQIAHGLGRIPKIVLFSVRNTNPNITVSEYKAPDNNYIYLIATAQTNCYWYVE